MPASRNANLGQFFTSNASVQDTMASLVSHTTGIALEPSAGEGHLASALLRKRPNLQLSAYEIDDSLQWRVPGVERDKKDFFSVLPAQSFDVIIANPPYLPLMSTRASTRRLAQTVASRYHKKVNLYQLFLDVAIDHLRTGGELVAIVPGEWVYSTAASVLREKFFSSGAITHFIHCGEEKLFPDADLPFLCILRFVKGAPQKRVKYWSSFSDASSGKRASSRVLVSRGTRWALFPPVLAAQVSEWTTLSACFDVKVGLVTGAEDVFRLPTNHGLEPETVALQVTSERDTAEYLFLEEYGTPEDLPPKARAYIKRHKKRLMKRRIRRFSEDDFHRYGAVRNLAAMRSETQRFYALAKTRHPDPFFLLDGTTLFNGSVVGVFARTSSDISCGDAVRLLNSTKYRAILEGMMLLSGEKVSLQHATIADLPFPPSLNALEEFLA